MTGLLKRQISGRLKPAFLTFAIITIYAAVMICTNGRFTILDDEANFIAAAAQPPLAQLHDFFTGSGLHELHPPTVTILLHLWLVATH